jgi:hypothetical protein
MTMPQTVVLFLLGLGFALVGQWARLAQLSGEERRSAVRVIGMGLVSFAATAASWLFSFTSPLPSQLSAPACLWMGMLVFTFLMLRYMLRELRFRNASH